MRGGWVDEIMSGLWERGIIEIKNPCYGVARIFVKRF